MKILRLLLFIAVLVLFNNSIAQAQITVVDTAKANVFAVGTTGVSVTHGFTLQNNDVLVAVVGQGDNSGTALASSSGGTWTANGFIADATQDDRTIASVYRRVTDAGSEPSSYTFTFNAATSETMAVIVLQLRGVDATTAVDATTTTSVNVDDFTPANPAITTATNGAVVVIAHLAVLGDGVASGKTGGAPSGYSLSDTEFFDAGADLFELFLEVAVKTVAVAGTETPTSWTGSPDAGTEEYALLTMAFRPAAVAGPSLRNLTLTGVGGW